jgi:hypothetical protein
MSQYEEVLTASNVKGNITIVSHRINIDHLMKEIYTKKDRHMAAYGKMPKYMKLPIWVYKWMCECSTGYTRNIPELRVIPGLGDVTFLGFLCCPTPSINEIEEIELF